MTALPSQWQCSHCLYSNECTLTHCYVCEGAKPSRSLTPKTTIIRTIMQHSSPNYYNTNHTNNTQTQTRKHNHNYISSNRAKTPQLIDDEDEDDLKSHRSLKQNNNKNAINHNKNGIIIDTTTNHGFNFNINPIPTPTNQPSEIPSIPHPKPPPHRSDKVEIDASDSDNETEVTPEISRKPISSPNRYNSLRWGNCVRSPFKQRINTIERDRKLSDYRNELHYFKQTEQSLKISEWFNNRNTMDLLQEIQKYKSDLLNKIDALNEISDGKQWYPMMHFNDLNSKFTPDIYRFEPKQYDIYLRKLNENILRYRVNQEMILNEADRKRTEHTNESMWEHLLTQCDNIKQSVGNIDVFYHKGSYENNRDLWKFKNNKQRQEYGNALVDTLTWYNTHDNKSFNDDKIGVICFEKVDDSNGSFGYRAQFKRMGVSEYMRYKQRFAQEMNDYYNVDIETNEHGRNPVYNRVIKMRFKEDRNRNRKRKLDVYDVGQEPMAKRQRKNADDDNTVVLGRNAIVNDEEGTGFGNFRTMY